MNYRPSITEKILILRRGKKNILKILRAIRRLLQNIFVERMVYWDYTVGSGYPAPVYLYTEDCTSAFLTASNL